MKRAYARPMIAVEEFTPNEYIAACQNKKYYFNCDVDDNMIYYYPHKDGKFDGLNKGSAVELGSCEPCKFTHVTDSTNDFYEGYYYTGKKNKIKVPIVVCLETSEHWFWGTEIDNWHATTNLDINGMASKS